MLTMACVVQPEAFWRDTENASLINRHILSEWHHVIYSTHQTTVEWCAT